MKRTRAQQPKVVEEPQDPAAATNTAANPKPQRRAKQPRQPKAGGGAKATKPGAAGPRVAAAAAAAASANAAGSAASSPPGAIEMAPTVPDVLCVVGGREGDPDADDARAMDWELDDDAGLNATAAWRTWGVDEEKLLGWFPFVEEDFRCVGGRAGDAEVAVFDHDIWSIW